MRDESGGRELPSLGIPNHGTEDSEHIRASYFICYTPRSGSTLLCDLLASTEVAGRPEEYFDPETKAALQKPVWSEDWRIREFSETLSRIKTYGTTPNGIFASKLKWHELPVLDRRLRSMMGGEPQSTAHLLAATFPHPRYVWITRRDKIRQAVSLYRARQSDEWIQTTGQPHPGDNLTFNYHLIDLALRHIVRLEAAWAEFFSQSGIMPYTVVYEDLVQDHEQIACNVLNYLHIGLPDEFSFPPPRVQRQADTLSEEWVRRYRETERARARRTKFLSLPSVLFTPALWNEYLWPAFRRSMSSTE